MRLHVVGWNKEKQEIDFLIVRDGVPWLPVEVKSGELAPSEGWKALGQSAPALQPRTADCA
jgi:hypothetical protein